MADLFDSTATAAAAKPSAQRPLADRLRPQALTDVIGQAHVLADTGPLGAMVAAGQLSSLILWGPPGVGKTTIARLLADLTDLHFVQISAIFTGVAELKKLFEQARHRQGNGTGTLLFVDEIHRFNKSQQDGFLPYMEDGTIVLVGATTENPSFELNAALLSRAQVIVLHRLELADLEHLAQRAEGDMGRPLPLTAAARDALLEMADGDGRALLNLIEQVMGWPAGDPMTPDGLATRLMRRAAKYDKSGDEHYNLISALHKSVRGSDPDAALYWMARMFAGGEDPRYLARRLTRMAVEDIGLADTNAQAVCLEAWQTYERLGSPEGELALAQAVIYLALAPKSNAGYVAWKAAQALARKTGSAMPPKHILNAPTGMMKDQGYGAGYAYDHDAEDGFSGQNYFPDGVKRPALYLPLERGFERDLKKRLEFFERLRAKRQGS
ncbi:replication-associated recombination protein A [Roseicitreum antarcticum]|uniref:Replication-associated recombination protein A n=1 Tax=Roseicitreum antarcticum TaxID=564137 RepID=A0A1H2X0Y2_9RHOB|nr:replication-associated recombination protein A [Roseicitreum antarcticum]SDW86426.1 putative ATPase [Roseicitreum antarcticum]